MKLLFQRTQHKVNVMQLYLTTPNHCLEKQGNAYSLRNLQSGQLRAIQGIDALMLELDLRGCSFGQLDSILDRYEGQ
jgi:hypothetical protein